MWVGGLRWFWGGVLHNRCCKPVPRVRRNLCGCIKRVCEVLVGLVGVEVVGAEETVGALLVLGERLAGRPQCGVCGGGVRSKGWKRVR